MRKRIKIDHLLTKDEALNIINIIINEYMKYFPYIDSSIEQLDNQLRVTINYQFINYSQGLLSLTISLNKKVKPNISIDNIKHTLIQTLFSVIYNRKNILLRQEEQQFILDNINYIKNLYHYAHNDVLSLYEAMLPYFKDYQLYRLESWIIMEKMEGND